MPCSPSFVDHALDLVAGLGPVEARRMFGGYGLFLRGAMLGLLDDDELFLKTDDETRPRFLAAGCRVWTYGDMTSTGYYRPPDEAHEDAEAMLPWARLAAEASARALAAKAAKAARAAARREKAARAGAVKGQAVRAAEAPAPRGRARGRAAPARRASPRRRPSR